MDDSRRDRSAAAIVATLALASCATGETPIPIVATPSQPCRTQIIVTFTADAAPDDAFVTEVSLATRVHLTRLSSAGPGLHVFALTADDADASCADALARLRGDSRVRSVDVDGRRAPQG